MGNWLSLRGLSAILLGGAMVLWPFAALPATTNYSLNSYGFGSGGTSKSATSNYGLEGITGEASTGQPSSTATYSGLPGFIQTQQANVPKVTLTNPSSYYDKLHFVIDTQSNPTDTGYALQVCTGSDFVPAGSCSSYQYIHSDDTLVGSLALADYQTYTSWGGSGGANIIGLTPGTTYYVRALAVHGLFNRTPATTVAESQYGPSSNAATVTQQITYCVYTTTCGSSNSTSLSGIVAGSVSTASPNIGVNFATNADNGGFVYIYSLNSGLKSTRASFTLASATANLTAAASGYGAQVSSTTQTSGGPIASVSPYNGTLNSVGILNTTVATILSSSAPVVGGQATIQLKAKASITTPAVNDYADTLTLIAAASF